MKLGVLVLVFLAFQNLNAWQVTFDCTAHGKGGADIDDLIVKSVEDKPRDSNEDAAIAASVKSLVIGKKSFKDLTLKGQRSYSVKGPYYNLNAEPSDKVIKSISISANPSGEAVGADTVETVDGKVHEMTCNEASSAACAAPTRPTKVHKEATWVGGCDGGVWIYIAQLKSDRVQLKIFNSDTGEIVKASWFSTPDGCQSKTKALLKSDFNGFDGEVVLLKRLNSKEEPSQNCVLKPVK